MKLGGIRVLTGSDVTILFWKGIREVWLVLLMTNIHNSPAEDNL
jgi:predicted DCC family thiol-disulfide oxidoreductase YuxK